MISWWANGLPANAAEEAVAASAVVAVDLLKLVFQHRAFSSSDISLDHNGDPALFGEAAHLRQLKLSKPPGGDGVSL